MGKRAYVPAGEAVRKLEAHLPEGFKFVRARYFHGQRNGVRVWFARRPVATGERRPKLRLMDLGSVKAMRENPGLLDKFMKAYAGQRLDDMVIDVLLTDAQARELFGLGANVVIESVKGDWEGKPKPGHGKCKGFALRCREE